MLPAKLVVAVITVPLIVVCALAPIAVPSIAPPLTSIALNVLDPVTVILPSASLAVVTDPAPLIKKLSPASISLIVLSSAPTPNDPPAAPPVSYTHLRAHET